VDRFRGSKRTTFVALAALAIVLMISVPSEARGGGGGGFGGGHSGGAVSQGGFGHGGVEGHHFEGRHFDRDFHGRFGFAPVLPYYGYDPYSAPNYWYYCPSYGAYYPNVQSCPDAWVPVQAS